MARSSRKQEILQAALACFTECGVEATTIEMIRDRSGAHRQPASPFWQS